MKILSFYKWIAGSMADFILPFKNNDALSKQARAYWNNLEGMSTIFLLIFLAVGILMAVWYYGPYNDRPGRHYTPKHWFLFLGLTFVIAMLATWGFEYVMVPPRLAGASLLQLRIAVGNALYASGLYFMVSVVWCFALPTNAYRMFKFI